MTAPVIPKNAIELVKKFEGLKLTSYLCPSNKWTIGYGHTFGVVEGQTITKEQADIFLQEDLYDAMNGALRYCPILADYPEKLGAIISFVFNLGTQRLRESTLRKRINEQNWEEAAKEIKKWVYAGKVILPGLIKRRIAESKYLADYKKTDQIIEELKDSKEEIKNK